MTDCTFIQGGADLLDAMGPLWQKLTQHHAGISTYFGDQFRNMRWPERKADLVEKSQEGRLHIVLAQSSAGKKCVGYCVGAINRKGHAEIESLFVEEKSRNKKIGSKLVEIVLAWFDQHKVKSTMVNVAVGNEDAFKFYEQWGFFPRVTALVKKRKK